MNDEKTSLILIVDDNPKNLQVLGNILKQEGYKLAAATNGPQALEFALKKGPDLILLDIMMPGMDGFEVCERLKNEPTVRDVPVIFLSARTETESAAKSFEKGAVDYVSKPFNTKELLARVKTQLQLKHATERLRREKEKAEEATKLKDKFVSLVAHDLKAPFTTIVGFLELLRDDPKNPLQQEQKEILGSVIRNGEGLVRMIEELLQISRFQTGKVSLEKTFFDGHYLTASVAATLDLLAKKKGINLENEVGPGTRLYGDMDLFAGVIQNLLSNAIKFCNKGDIITLFAPSDQKATIAVKDTGIGMSKESQGRIFQHEEVTSTRGTAGEKGTGFGMPLSRDIMEAHNGTLTLESSEGEGSIFYASLPFVRPKILVVDDEDSLRELFKTKFRSIDVEFIEAEDGEKAIEILKTTTPHFIFLDIMMPVMGGFPVLKYIRNNPSTKTTPVVVVTCNDKIETREKAFKMGANDFVNKPLVMEELIPRVRRFVC